MQAVELKNHDLALLKDLQPTGWPDIIPFFDFYIRTAHCFPIKLVAHGEIVGVGTTIIHEDVAWLAHIIVHPTYRNQGIGKKLTQILVDSLKDKNCQTINLIATDLGAPVYEKLGFQTETEYIFYQDLVVPSHEIDSQNLHLITEDLAESIMKLDLDVTAENRWRTLESHLKDGYIYRNGSAIEGFYLPSLGEGLIIAKNSTAGIELMKQRLIIQNNAVFPIDNNTALEFMSQHHFISSKKEKRMWLGKKRHTRLTNMYNRIGGNMG